LRQALRSIRRRRQVGGRAVAIEYESDKLNGGGDGTKATYRHEFAPGDMLATDQDGRTLYVIGPRLRVNSRGIVD
jgi:hypothetical protein